MQEKHTGLIIHEQDVGEADRIVTLLTADYGIIRAFAKGSKRVKGKLFAATKMFTYGDFMLYKGRDKFIITEGERRAGFFGRIENITALALAQYICELCCYAIPLEQPTTDDGCLRLVLNTLYAIDKHEYNLSIIKAAFEFRIAAMCGYCPEVTGCTYCGKSGGDMYFNADEGTLLCVNCEEKHRGETRISASIILAIRYILSCDVRRIFAFSLSNEAAEQLSLTAEKYLITQLERNFKTLDFYNSLI